jgi:threonine dehydrogenase-like Zn-dependent dehydrogenase
MLLESGQIDVEDMITHRLPLTEIIKGFELVTQQSDSLKVIIRPQLK